MKIKFLRDERYPQVNPENSRQYKAGEVYDVPDDHAQRWLRRGSAVEVKTGKASQPQAMVPAPPKKAVVHESIAGVRAAAVEKLGE